MRLQPWGTIISEPSSEVAPWWRGATLYQIYPRSFFDADGDGVGDLAGVRQKLAYVRSLGVDGVWLSPFFKSPMRDYGYDVADYRAVDPMFGDLKAFDRMMAEARRRGLKVLIDQVYSHTSSDHKWFRASRQDRSNPFADWYVWADPKPDGTPPNNWLAWFGGACWTWEPRRAQYFLHNFLPTQPDLNFHNPAVQDAVLDVARFWLDRGVDGFRLDVANYYAHDAALRDNPPKPVVYPALPFHMQEHRYNAFQPESLDFHKRLRAVMDSYGERMSVAEIGNGDAASIAAYTSGDDRLHTAYGFSFLTGPMRAEAIAEAVAPWASEGDHGWPSWSFSNHDFRRVVSRWGYGIDPAQFAKFALTLLLTLRGTIFLYQGEELGLPEAELSYEDLHDPAGLAGWPAYKGRDGCRTPMPWTGHGAHCGFSQGHRTWLPVPEAHRPLAVSEQERDPNSVLHFARRMIRLRQGVEALRLGDLHILSAQHPKLVFERRLGPARVVCAFNLSRATISVSLDKAARDGAVLVMENAEATRRGARLGPRGAVVILAGL